MYLRKLPGSNWSFYFVLSYVKHSHCKYWLEIKEYITTFRVYIAALLHHHHCIWTVFVYVVMRGHQTKTDQARDKKIHSVLQ